MVCRRSRECTPGGRRRKPSPPQCAFGYNSLLSGYRSGSSQTIMSQMIAQPPLLISEDYRRMQQKLHENPDYGEASVGTALLVAQIMEAVGATELLDYGAGKGRLGVALRQHLKRPQTIHHYDPAVPQWSAPPVPCGFVACIDVLEHIEPQFLDNVLDGLQRVTAGVGVFTVQTGAALKVLPDGRPTSSRNRPDGGCPRSWSASTS